MNVEGSRRTSVAWVSSIIILTLAMAFAASPLAARGPGQDTKGKKGKSAGFVLSENATAEDVGLPLYPGSQRLKEKDENSAVRLGMWGHSGGFKLVVLKLESGDAPVKIAAFYRQALGKYGHVLECGQGSAKPAKAGTSALDCDDDEPVEGGFSLKAGTKEKQHIVGVEPKGNRSKIALVYLENPNSQ